MRRAFSAWLLVAVVLAGLGGVAYLSHNPTSVWLTRLRSLPVVGTIAGKFQDAYRAPQRQDAAPASRVSIVVVPPSEEDLDVHPYTHLAPGATLRERPEANARALKRLDRFYVVPYFRRSGDWVLVRLGGQRGWIRVGPPPKETSPPLGDRPSPPLPLAERAAPRALLAAAEAEMVTPRSGGRLGPYRLLTDVVEPGLIPVLDRLVRQIEPLYRRRYGLIPVGRPRATIAIFAHKAAFDALNRSEPRLRGLTPEGTMVPGLVALYAEGRNRAELEATLVHELTHLLNRRALGPALPSWLDEGMAEDLASSRITPEGTIDPAVLGGMKTLEGNRETLMGARAGVVELARRMVSGQTPRLARLTTMDWRSFVAEPGAAEHYREAGLLIRFLATGPALSGQESPPSKGLREFLHAVADGRPATGEALRDDLGVSWSELEASFLAWLKSRIPPPFTIRDEVLSEAPQAPSTGS